MIKQIYKSGIQNYRDYSYDLIHKRQAMNALKSIKKVSKYSLSRKETRVCDEYSTDVLGSKKYAPWLYVYTAFNQEFREGWIPDNYFGSQVYRVINNQIGEISEVKTLTQKLLNTDLVPDVGYCINNIFYSKDYERIFAKDLEKYLLDLGFNEYYIKLDSSNQGRGVFTISMKDFDLNKFKNLKNFVIQSPISQNEWFNEIIDSPGATIRITTVRNKLGAIETRAASLRIANQQSDIVKHYNSIRIPINITSGTLFDFGADSYWAKYEKHPVSGYRFNNKVIPSFIKARNQLENLHKNFMHYDVIGWDISINLSGNMEIIEWNANHPGIKFHEAFSGPNFTGLGWEDLWR